MREEISKEISIIYNSESGKVLASLFRILGDFELAEEAMHEAFSIAIQKWPEEGIPNNPYSWLISTGKFKAIDSIRRESRGKEIVTEKFFPADKEHTIEKNIIEDDQLRLIFYCCHSALPLDSRIALSLRDICGMKTEEIAHAYFVSSETVKKRISRAKALFREKKIPYEIPNKAELTNRMNAVLHVIYLIFNEGYSASSGEEHIRKDLSNEAIFLCRTLVNLISTSESMGLLALLLIQEARRESRVKQDGEVITLEWQDRSLWNQNFIHEGLELLNQSIKAGKMGPYTIQAAIASVHATANSFESTRWDLIVNYYDMLLKINQSPIVELNRAIAVGQKDGPSAGLTLIKNLMKKKKLTSYHLIYSAKADFLKKLGEKEKAIQSYQKALELVNKETEKKYLQNQLSELIN